MNKRILATLKAAFAGLMILLPGSVTAPLVSAESADFSTPHNPQAEYDRLNQVSQAETAKSGSELEADFFLSSGYRIDKLEWKTSSGINLFGQAADVSSELTWKDLEIFQLKLQGTLFWPGILALKASAGYGWILDGDNRDSDFIEQNGVTQEFSRSNNSADSGNVMDASLGIGYPWRRGRRVVWGITPLLGYSYHKQNLTITDGIQKIPDSGPIPGLDSTYETRWQGPWIGLDLRMKAAGPIAIIHRLQPYACVEYHWADYTADANWNLRSDLSHPKSFRHNADGNGIVVAAGLDFALAHRWALNLNFDYQDWSADDGEDTTYFADGTTEKIRLKRVNWTSYALSLGVGLQF